MYSSINYSKKFSDSLLSRNFFSWGQPWNRTVLFMLLCKLKQCAKEGHTCSQGWWVITPKWAREERQGLLCPPGFSLISVSLKHMFIWFVNDKISKRSGWKTFYFFSSNFFSHWNKYRASYRQYLSLADRECVLPVTDDHARLLVVALFFLSLSPALCHINPPFTATVTVCLCLWLLLQVS